MRDMSDILVRFVHISDTHINPDPEYGKAYGSHHPNAGAKALVDHINNLPFQPDFVLHTGDVAYDPVADVYTSARDILSQLNAPLYAIAGNHDHQTALQRVIMGYDDSALQSNLHYEFEVNGVQIICVDSNAPAQPPRGRVPDDQLAWLESLCKADDDRPLIIAIHHHPYLYGSPWLDTEMRIENGEAFHTIVKQATHRLRGVFHGHIHQVLDAYIDGVLYASAASSWYQILTHADETSIEPIGDEPARPGYNVVTITRQQTIIRRYAFSV